MPLRDLLRWMIIVSDNTATNALIRLLTMERINDFCARMGWKDSKVERLMLDFDAVKAGKNNYTSALDQFRMFRAIYQKSILTPELCDLAMDMLLGQRDCGDFLRYIPGPVKVAHKTGGLDFLEHDSGLFFLGKATLYLGVFSDRRAGRCARLQADCRRCPPHLRSIPLKRRGDFLCLPM